MTRTEDLLEITDTDSLKSFYLLATFLFPLNKQYNGCSFDLIGLLDYYKHEIDVPQLIKSSQLIYVVNR